MMRTYMVILLLLCASIAGAQIPVPESTYRWVIDTPARELPDEMIMYGDTAQFNPRGMKVQLNDMLMCLGILWDQYSAECYADSQKIMVDSGGVPHSCLVYGCRQIWDVPPVRVWTGEWYHATRSFPHFMEYLRRKQTAERGK